MERVVLAGGAVFDARSGAVSRADVVLAGDRIVAVGVGLSGDVVVDCAGGLLVPGFIDCHTHVSLTQTLGSATAVTLPRSARQLSAVPVLATLLRNGVTTVRDAWGADAGLRLAVRQGWVAGPDILVSLRQVGTTGGLGDHWVASQGTVDAFGDPSMPDPVFDGPEAARAVVRRMVRAGADWIKVTATGSMARGVGVHDVQLTRAEMSALVDEAVNRGRRVMVHAHGARAAELAARAGAHSIEHGVFLDEAAVAAMAEAGTWFVPTLSVTQADPEHAPEGTPEAHRHAVRLAVRAGVPIAMGTDNPVRPHTEVLREIEYLALAGLGPVEALRAATWQAARLLGVADDRGEIAEGKRADLVLLDGTSVEPAGLADRIRAVWHNGRVVAGRD
ncbi:amidohydrolase family protein [Goodfellowiella coeruleoviolacea]|uniref:amidohydrolase family protein n=1 Tax=Goodfellowiella coeruleoviolacea TaxID=334858 RepID=UPI0020A5DB16|nr:amidohydrolase family protein [Goodfellowiella coeruleoviolacea]